ncbi:Uncharacterized protein APZ42_010546, partial [Daphnia magna]
QSCLSNFPLLTVGYLALLLFEIGLQTRSKIGRKSQRIKRAQLRRDGLLPAWVEPPRPSPARERIPDEQLPAEAHAPSLQPFLEIARRLITVEQREATRPRHYGDIRYAPPGIPVGYPKPQPEPVTVPAPQPVPVPAAEPVPAPAPQPAPAPEPRPAP